MKFTLPLTILAVAVSVDAAAVMEQDKRYCHAEGQACDTSGGETATIAARQIHELALAIAASHDDPAKFFSSLGFHSAQKREADPGCSSFIGMPCWKRSAEPEAEPDRFCTRFTGSSCWKRDGSAAAADEAKRCVEEGGACWQAKRAAAAVINTIDQGNALKMARDADPGWCDQFIGMPCWKRSETCNGPAGVCTKATRDLHAMYNAARSIIEA
ncbi:hypothetical protein NEMBOFW57_002748 [Staphylotrichum longicolle]|uniref:Clock-controlled pheromone ccg-4 n=1 Tax=Staphylotrichum longicolle TaxID=669026 RepID=A0AAD4I3Y1_9PEZI|nr:hypothetical protein NEMBOFW57_002748 [Staphylotrichum longicolle]